MLNYTFASYAAFLATGHSIQCKVIKSTSISQYLLDAARLFSSLDPENRDPRLDTRGNICKEITTVINRAKKFESIPNRVEPFLPAMQDWLVEHRKKLRVNSFGYAMSNWCAVNFQAGNCQCKCFQPRGKRHSTNFEKNIMGDPYAFTRNDIEFIDTKGRVISWETVSVAAHWLMMFKPNTAYRRTRTMEPQKNFPGTRII